MTGSRWIVAGELLLVGCGVLFLGMNLIAGSLYGASLHLDPTSPTLLAMGLHGLVVAAFFLAGALMLLVSAALAVALAWRQPWARPAAIVLAVFYALVGLLPLSAVVIYAMLRPDVTAAFPRG